MTSQTKKKKSGGGGGGATQEVRERRHSASTIRDTNAASVTQKGTE